MGFEGYATYICLIPCTNIPLARRLNVPIYQLLGGKVRDKIKVYAWIGGDRPSDIASQA